MNFFNLLATEISFYDGILNNVNLSGITKLVGKVIDFFSFGGYIAMGIIIFSLILKILPLPLDIYSRAANKKNALKMEKMRPELEKLQKQYANNKELYNQKMMALYKKEGYSQLAACLPTLVTLVFFIVVITAFQQYSSFCKIRTFNDMAVAYSDSIRNDDNVKGTVKIGETVYDIEKVVTVNDKKYVIYYKEGSEEKTEEVSRDNIETVKFYYIDSGEEAVNKVKTAAQNAAAEKYKEEQSKSRFLWVKNIWIEDLPWKKSFVDKNAYTNSTFNYSSGCKQKKINSSIANANAYDDIFGSEYIKNEMKKPNGYLVLVALSIISMLVSQLVMTKTQKAQMELQSVDGANGQAAQTAKMMNWMMPVMFGLFAFMYTASFSLYLIISTVFSMGSTLIINKCVEKSFEKKLKKEEEEKYRKRYGYLAKNKEDQK